MASYNPPKKGSVFVMYLALRSQADVRMFQINPTLATGDVKISKDGGVASNVATLPTVVSSTAIVKLELSGSEMNADNVAILFSDTAGGQWCDLLINLQTAAGQFDDLAAIKVKTDNLPPDPADDSDIDAQLASIASYIDTEIAMILAAVDTEIAAIKAKTDNLPPAPAAVGSPMTLAANAVDASALATSAVTKVQAGLSTLTTAEVNAEMVDVLTIDTYAEPSSVPAATSSIVSKLGWLFTMARNKRVTSVTQDRVRNDADSADVGTAGLSDDGSEFTRGKYG